MCKSTLTLLCIFCFIRFAQLNNENADRNCVLYDDGRITAWRREAGGRGDSGRWVVVVVMMMVPKRREFIAVASMDMLFVQFQAVGVYRMVGIQMGKTTHAAQYWHPANLFRSLMFIHTTTIYNIWHM